ncbi:C_GCAxxG_C_C family protein [bacterium]|nr:C_GCAxxG_C_C family protein [bacterium]
MIKENAIKYFMNGYSCSECIIQACIDAGICDALLLPCSTTFSAGMSSGCSCGSIAGAQIILGYIFGRENKFGNNISAREKASEFVEEFKNRNKVTCCRILSAGYSGSERKMHCSKFVSDACDILEELIKVKTK